ncbi:MAG TPA: distal tail protein Dit [Metabacillus sp.]|nr:distal tail protein Dit [Metabacillus sp.]
MGLTFNNIRKDYLTVLSKKRPTFAPVSHNLITIPKRPGAYVHGHETDIRTIEVNVLINGENISDLQKIKEDLAQWLISDGTPKELTFDDEPDRVYYALISDQVDFEEIVRIGSATLVFICPDPYKHGLEYTHQFNSSGVLEFINDGSVDAFPTYEIDVSKDTTFLSILNNDSHITIGKPEETNSVVTMPRDMILYDKFESMSGWNPGAAIQDGFIQMGSIYVKNGNFVPQSFGGNVDANSYKWRGPAYVKQLPRSLQDFELECFMEMKSYRSTPAERATELGRIAIYLLDINNQVIGKMFVEDPTEKTMMVKGVAKLGPEAATKTIMEYSNQAYNQFDGFINIRREGKWWHFQIGMYDTNASLGSGGTFGGGEEITGRRYGRYNAQFYDTDGTYQTKVAKIQVGFMQYKNYNWASMLLDTMRVWELSGTGGVPAPEDVPVIAQSGDRIEIETSTGQIYRNGEPWYKRLDPTSHFFPLKPGVQRVTFYPNDIGTVKARVRKRWL